MKIDLFEIVKRDFFQIVIIVSFQIVKKRFLSDCENLFLSDCENIFLSDCENRFLSDSCLLCLGKVSGGADRALLQSGSSSRIQIKMSNKFHEDKLKYQIYKRSLQSG